MRRVFDLGRQGVFEWILELALAVEVGMIGLW
jgi:hypothetical protein